MIHYGDIYWAHIPGYGSDKARPWVVVSDNDGKDLMVIPCTTVPPHTPSIAYVSLTINGKASWAKCSHVVTIKPEVLGNYIDRLSTPEMARIANGIKATLHNDQKLPDLASIRAMAPDARAAAVTKLLETHKAAELAKLWDVTPNTVRVYAKAPAPPASPAPTGLSLSLTSTATGAVLSDQVLSFLSMLDGAGTYTIRIEVTQ